MSRVQAVPVIRIELSMQGFKIARVHQAITRQNVEVVDFVPTVLSQFADLFLLVESMEIHFVATTVDLLLLDQLPLHILRKLLFHEHFLRILAEYVVLLV